MSLYHSIVHREPVGKGWSADQKFFVTTEDGKKYLLRVSDIQKKEGREFLHKLMEQTAELLVPMCRSLECGVCDEGVYSIQSFIDGKDAGDVIPFCTDAEQYAYGIKAGQYLKKIHSIPAPNWVPEWEMSFNKKADIKIQKYLDCREKIENGQCLVDYINENRELLANRPLSFQHGDFHIGNMMVDKTGKLIIIDFDRFDFGDPWEEFNRIVWSAQASPLFASGIINGYFDDNVPEEFWRLLALYIASNALSSVPWAIAFGEAEKNTMRKQTEDILHWYDNMKKVIPSWYTKGYYLQELNGHPFKLAEPFDFSFLQKYGTVFKIFDDQDSGNICFGCEKDEKRVFVKFAGAPTEQYQGKRKDAVLRLKKTLPVYRELRHKNLIHLISEEEIAGGYAMIFDWADGDCMGRMYPAAHQKIMRSKLQVRLQIFSDVLDFLILTAAQGYLAVDFYDGSILYDFSKNKTTICDIDFFRKLPTRNDRGRMWGSSMFQSPEEKFLTAVLDERTNVYTAGAFAFALFGGYGRSRENFELTDRAFQIVQKATADDPDERQQTLLELSSEWTNEMENFQQISYNEDW